MDEGQQTLTRAKVDALASKPYLGVWLPRSLAGARVAARPAYCDADATKARARRRDPTLYRTCSWIDNVCSAMYTSSRTIKTRWSRDAAERVISKRALCGMWLSTFFHQLTLLDCRKIFETFFNAAGVFQVAVASHFYP